MAGPYYVRSSDGNDSDSGLTWALAKATIAGALAVAAAGERIWVSHAHAETQATAMTLTSAGTAAAPVEILCGNEGAEPPTALATTAQVTATGASAISFLGFAYVYGITFSAGTGAGANHMNFTSTAPWGFVFDTCSLRTPSTGISHFNIGTGSGAADDQFLWLKNTTFEMAGNASSRIIVAACRILMDGGAFIITSTPTIVFALSQPVAIAIRFRGVDLSIWGSGKSLVRVDLPSPSDLFFEHCKLGASVALVSGASLGPGGVRVTLDHCDSADTQYRMERYQYEGSVYSETTIFRTGGASNGTTPLSHRMAASANRTLHLPLYGPEMVIWNNTTGSAKTITVEIVHDSLTALTDAEVWLEVEYLGTSGFPLSLFASDRKADILATPAAQTSSSVGWTTGAITNVNKQKLEVTVTPQEIGVFRCRVALAKASYTIYVDPLLTVS
jgi:hypothetical protein